MKDYFTKEQEELIIHLYVDKGRGQLYCAKACGSTNVSKVKGVLRKNNIPIRDFSHAASLSNQNRAYKKNENYFDVPTSNMAWLVGFLASDGSISSSDNAIKIGLAKKDKEILEKIKKEVEIENKIKEYTTNNGHEVAELVWSCKKHKDALNKYCVTPNKTFTLQPPYMLPYKYWIDYIRGYFDGDGSVNLIYSNDKPIALRWQICSATEEILEWIVNFFYDEYNIPKVNIYYDSNHGKAGLYYFQYSTNNTKQIHNILYTPNSLCLNRKKVHFDEIISVI